MTGYAQPLWSIQVAFASNPLAAAPTWTEISQLVQTIKIPRGRQHVLNTMEPGRLTLTCWDQNRALDVSNTASPYYPNVDINKRIRVGIVVNAMTTAQAAITGGWTAGANTTATFPSGTLQLQATSSGSISASTPSGTAGFRVLAGVSYNATISASATTTSRTVTPSIAWYSQAGTLLSTSTLSGFSDLVGSFAQNHQTVTSPAGAWYAAMTQTVAGCGASEIHTFDNAGLVDTRVVNTNIPGAGNADNPVPLFTGFIDAVSPVWKSQMRNYVTITATDTLRILQQTKLPSDPYVGRVLGLGATQLWPLDDPSGTTSPRQLVPGGLQAFVFPGGGGTFTFGGSPRSGAILSPTASIVSVAGAFEALGIAATSAPVGAGAFAIECWIQPATGAAGSSGFIYQQYCLSTHARCYVYWDNSQALNIVVSDGSVTVTLRSNTVTLNDGNWHLVTAGRDGSGNYWIYLDGVQVSVPWTGAMVDPSNGGVSWAMWFYDAQQNAQAYTTASVSCATIYASGISTASILGNYQVGSAYFTTPKLSTSRMVDVMTLISLPSNLYAAAGAGSDVGRSNIQGAQSHPGMAHSYLQTVAAAENGLILARPDGVVVEFDRYHQQNVTPTVTFGDNGTTEIPYQVNPQFALDNVDLFNASTCQAVGGNQQTTVGTTTTQYGVTASLDETNLISAGGDAEMLGRSQWNVSRYQTPQMRIRAIDVDCLAHLSLVAPTLLASQPQQTVEIGQQVNVNRRPFSTSAGFSGAMFTQASMIEGIEHTIDIPAGKWHMTLHLSPADTQQYWVVGTSALDTGTRLAY